MSEKGPTFPKFRTCEVKTTAMDLKEHEILLNKLIRIKREGGKLNDEQIKTIVEMVVEHKASDAQIGAMLMAIDLKGMKKEETVSLAKHMAFTKSKEINWLNNHPEWKGSIFVDKLSTGGLGDSKVSLVLAPALAACGLKVPMMCGSRLDMLDSSGGTLDKLESIPGFRVDLTEEEMLRALESPGCFIACTPWDIAPCCHELLDRRVQTDTVVNRSLFVSSTVSTVVAMGTDALVVDIKVGTGAVFGTWEEATELANDIIDVAKELGVRASAVFTRMDEPIGRAVGSSHEVAEAIECMKGNGPRDLEKLVTELGAALLPNFPVGKDMIKSTLTNGSALDKFEEMLTKQGVDADTARKLCLNPWSVLERAPHKSYVTARKTGVVSDINFQKFDQAFRKLRSVHVRYGRRAIHPSEADKTVHHNVGVKLARNLQIGVAVTKGAKLLKVYHFGRIPRTKRQLKTCVTIATPPPPGTVLEPIGPI